MYYKGLNLLEFLSENGMTHGHINANSLGVTDSYTFTLSDFSILNMTPQLGTIPTNDEHNENELSKASVCIRGFIKATKSKKLQARLVDCE